MSSISNSLDDIQIWSLVFQLFEAVLLKNLVELLQTHCFIMRT